MREYVDEVLDGGTLWPEPLIQLNPAFEAGESLVDLVAEGVLHAECERIFRIKSKADPIGVPMQLHRHQTEAIRTAASGRNYVLTTGTGSGKSLAYIIPIVDRVLRLGSGKGIKADRRLPDERPGQQPGQASCEKFLELGYPEGQQPVTFARYTGQEIGRGAAGDHGQPAGHPADQLRDARADPDAAARQEADRGRRRPAVPGARRAAHLPRPPGRGRGDARAPGPRPAVQGRSCSASARRRRWPAGGGFDEQRAEVARVATRLFGDDGRARAA